MPAPPEPFQLYDLLTQNGVFSTDPALEAKCATYAQPGCSAKWTGDADADAATAAKFSGLAAAFGGSVSTSIEDYARRLVRYGRFPPECGVLAIALLKKLQRNLRDATRGDVPQLPATTQHRLLFSACLLAIKLSCDLFERMSFYATLGGVSLRDVQAMETQFMSLLDFTFFVSAHEYCSAARGVPIADDSGESDLADAPERRTPVLDGTAAAEERAHATPQPMLHSGSFFVEAAALMASPRSTEGDDDDDGAAWPPRRASTSAPLTDARKHRSVPSPITQADLLGLSANRGGGEEEEDDAASRGGTTPGGDEFEDDVASSHGAVHGAADAERQQEGHACVSPCATSTPHVRGRGRRQSQHSPLFCGGAALGSGFVATEERHRGYAHQRHFYVGASPPETPSSIGLGPAAKPQPRHAQHVAVGLVETRRGAAPAAASVSPPPHRDDEDHGVPTPFYSPLPSSGCTPSASNLSPVAPGHGVAYPAPQRTRPFHDFDPCGFDQSETFHRGGTWGAAPS